MTACLRTLRHAYTPALLLAAIVAVAYLPALPGLSPTAPPSTPYQLQPQPQHEHAGLPYLVQDSSSGASIVCVASRSGNVLPPYIVSDAH